MDILLLYEIMATLWKKNSKIALENFLIVLTKSLQYHCNSKTNCGE